MKRRRLSAWAHPLLTHWKTLVGPLISPGLLFTTPQGGKVKARKDPTNLGALIPLIHRQED